MGMLEWFKDLVGIMDDAADFTEWAEGRFERVQVIAKRLKELSEELKEKRKSLLSEREVDRRRSQREWRSTADAFLKLIDQAEDHEKDLVEIQAKARNYQYKAKEYPDAKKALCELEEHAKTVLAKYSLLLRKSEDLTKPLRESARADSQSAWMSFMAGAAVLGLITAVGALSAELLRAADKGAKAYNIGERKIEEAKRAVRDSYAESYRVNDEISDVIQELSSAQDALSRGDGKTFKINITRKDFVEVSKVFLREFWEERIKDARDNGITVQAVPTRAIRARIKDIREWIKKALGYMELLDRMSPEQKQHATSIYELHGAVVTVDLRYWPMLAGDRWYSNWIEWGEREPLTDVLGSTPVRGKYRQASAAEALAWYQKQEGRQNQLDKYYDWSG